MNKLMFVFVAVVGLLFASTARAEEPTVLTVHFDTDKSDILPQDKESLDALADAIVRDNLQVVITGHCDKRASRLYNLDLGQRRAEAVRDYLVSKGVKKSVVSVSYGKEKPALPPDVREHFAANRRAEITVITPEAVVKQVTVVDQVYVPVKAEPKKNRITLLGGVGPQGVSKTQLAPNKWLVDQAFNPVGGLQYSRLLTDRFSLSVQVLSNVSGFVGIGLDF